MFDAIFWDNDGVLMASEHLYFQANAETLARAGIALSLELFAEISLHGATAFVAGLRLMQPRAGESFACINICLFCLRGKW